MYSGRVFRKLGCALFLTAFSTLLFTACGGGSSSGTGGGGGGGNGPFALTVSVTGTGTVTSSPSGINCGSSCTASFAKSTSVTLTAAAGSGYTFTGWSGGCTGTSTCTIAISAASTVTATFIKNSTPSLTVTISGSGTVTSSPSGINCPTTCSATFADNAQVTLTATPANGFSFTGWSGASSCSNGTGTCVVTLSQATSVTATFTANPNPTLTVNVTPNDGGTVTSNPSGISCPGTCTLSEAAGTAITLTETPSSGFTFAGWHGGGCSGTGSCQVTLNNSLTVTATFNAPSSSVLTVNLSGTGTGSVSSDMAGISCPTTCSSSYPNGTQVTLTATAATNFVFGGWSGGGCSGTGTCVITLNSNTTVDAAFGGSLSSLNHIIIFAQENRSFDSYFGSMRQYWAQNGIPDQPFDGLPQFNPNPGPVSTNPGCDPADPFPANCTIDSASPAVASYHLLTRCVENPSPSWNESHNDWNVNDPTSSTPKMDGFVHAAANDARHQGFFDVSGLRSMGYYNASDLNFYYFMASNFATSDRWFSPAMSRTQINRMYILSATSQGHAYPLQTGDPQIAAPPIFEELQNAGVSWKIYVRPSPTPPFPNPNGCVAFDTRPLCLYEFSYINMFTYGHKIINDPVLIQNIVPMTQFTTDAQNGTLPQVALIEPASSAGLDEHPADNDPSAKQPVPCCSIQGGASYAESVINTLMTSPSWKDSAMLFTYDEFGGFYDHVPPQPMVSPDGIPPLDLLPGDDCTSTTGPTCDFTYTGYRVPLIVISPFARKNYVSHLVADSTAMLKLIEERFNVPPLTKRDAVQIDMGAEFFDFTNVPWATPPTPPNQVHNGQCYLDALP